MGLQLNKPKEVCGTNGGCLIVSCFVMIHDAVLGTLFQVQGGLC